jgi:tetratricopeptide (TPR) repeat protein
MAEHEREHDHAELRRLFDLAIEAEPDERSALLDGACGEDDALKRRVMAMLAAAEDESFLGAATSGSNERDLPTVMNVSNELAGKQIGRYRLLELIGEGGFGSVWMAEQREPGNRTVALKIIKLGMDTKQVIGRFEAERQALALMDHPNIAKVLDGGATDTGRPYFVMELVKGQPITAHCDKHGLGVGERLLLFQQVCHAVQHAHQKGIIHRDLKPSNVLISMHDGEPVAKVIDFGIAKATSARLTEKTVFTEFRQFIGTPEYMSPEQAEPSGDDIDTRSDVYSLGVLLYELLTGVTPFAGSDLRSAGYGEIQRIIREETPPRPSTKLSSLETLPSIAAHRRTEPKKLGTMIRGDLDWIVMKAMEKDRRRRYESASGLAEDIERHLRSEPVTASPPGALYKLGKFARRNRVAVVAGSMIAAALVIGVVGTTWGMLWALDERARVTAQAETARDAIGEANEIVIGTFDELASEYGENSPRELPGNEALASDGMEVDALGIASRNLAIFLSRSLKDEARSRRNAERHAERAEQVLDQLMKFSDDTLHTMNQELKYLEGSLTARRKLIEMAKEYLEGLSIQVTDRPQLRERVALAHYRIADLLAGVRQPGVNDVPAAVEHHQTALGIRLELLAADPEVAHRLFQVAESHNALGGVLRRKGEASEAIVHFREALRIRRVLVGMDPSMRWRRLHEARAIYQLADGLFGTDDKAECLPLYEQALDMIRTICAEHPDWVLSQKDLAAALSRTASALAEMGRDAEAIGRYREAIGVRQRVVDAHPDDRRAGRDLIMARYYMSSKQIETGDLTGAEENLVEPLAYLTRAHELSPSDGWAANSLAWVHWNVGELRLLLCEYDEAEPHFAAFNRLITDLSEADPANTHHRLYRGQSHQFLAALQHARGDHDPAIEHATRAFHLVDELTRVDPDLVRARQIGANIEGDLGRYLAAAGRADEAEARLTSARASLAELDAILPDDRYHAVYAARILVDLARLALVDGDDADALALAQEALAQPPAMSDRPSAMREIVAAHVSLGEHAAAVRVAREALTFLDGSPYPDCEGIREALEDVVVAHGR